MLLFPYEYVNSSSYIHLSVKKNDDKIALFDDVSVYCSGRYIKTRKDFCKSPFLF